MQPNSPSLTISRSAPDQRASCTVSMARSIGVCTSVPPSKLRPIRSSSGCRPALPGVRSVSSSSPGPPKASSRHAAAGLVGDAQGGDRHRLGDVLRRARIEPEVSRHSTMGPRASASGACGAARARARLRVGPPVGQHRLALPRQQPRFGLARAPQLLQHRVAQHRGFAGEHALEPAGQAHAGDLARRVGQARLHGAQGQRGAGAVGGLRGGRRGHADAALAAAEPAQQVDQRRQLQQPLAGAGAPPATRASAAGRAVRPSAASTRSPSPCSSASSSSRPCICSRHSAANSRAASSMACARVQPRLVAGDAVQVPQQGAQHLLGQRRHAAGTAPAGRSAATVSRSGCVAAASPKSASSGGNSPATRARSQRATSSSRRPRSPLLLTRVGSHSARGNACSRS